MVPRPPAFSSLCVCAVSVLVTLIGAHLSRGVCTHTHNQHMHTHPAIITIWGVDAAACTWSPRGCLIFLHSWLPPPRLPLKTSHLHTSPSRLPVLSFQASPLPEPTCPFSCFLSLPFSLSLPVLSITASLFTPVGGVCVCVCMCVCKREIEGQKETIPF